jgi:hypothetical protein
VIVCAILTLFVGLLDALFALLPTWSWTAGDIPTTGTNITMWDQGDMAVSGSSALSGPWLALARTNLFMPVDHLLYAIQLLILVAAAGMAFRAAKFIINVVRGAGA